MKYGFPFDGILIISDMDKTLVTENFDVPKRNLDAINMFIDNGGRFALATGRSAGSAGRYLSKIKINAPCILSNGASIYDFSEGKILWNTCLDKSARSLLENILLKFPETGVEIYRNEKIYIVNNNKWTEKHIINEKIGFVECGLSEVPDGWQKILFADAHEVLIEIENYVKLINFDKCDFVFSNIMYYEALPRNISKGTAISKLASLCGVKTENTVGIGDYYNDLSLLKMSGYGAAVSGAPGELVKSADFVTGPCENGAVADLIEHLEKIPRISGYI